jgi:uncharacterized membrane protein YbhN (UPF0104 family)
MTRKRRLGAPVVFALVCGLVYFQLRQWRSFDWEHFRRASHVDPLHIVAAIGLVYITSVLRAFRWSIFLQPVRRTQTHRLISPTFVGFTGIALLGRPGEFIRPYLIAKKEDVSFSSQLGVWAVERIFDIGAFSVLTAIDLVFFPQIRSSPYFSEFRLVALALCSSVAVMSLGAVMIYRQTDAFAAFLHGIASRGSSKVASYIDEKVRAFGEGLNTISSGKAFLQLVIVSLTIWLVIALAYREVVHSYPPEPDSTTQKHVISFLDIETVLATPELAASEVTTAVVEKGTIAPGFQDCAMSHVGDLRLVQNGKRIKNVRDHQQLRDLDISRVVLLMGFSTLGSIVQLPAVGGGSQLAVITALQVVYGVPAEMAVSCGIVLWLVTSMSCIPMGLVFARREHLSLRRLSEESTHEKQESMPLG